MVSPCDVHPSFELIALLQVSQLVQGRWSIAGIFERHFAIRDSRNFRAGHWAIPSQGENELEPFEMEPGFFCL
jgi:hypothetical protein